MKSIFFSFLFLFFVSGCGTIPAPLELKDYSKKPDSKGWHYFRNGKYRGEINYGLPNGKGEYIYENGVEYSGRFRDGEIDGEGTLIIPTLGKFIGTFNRGMFTYGEVYYENGDYYHGPMENGNRNGNGFFSNSQIVYYGGFSNDSFHGEGSITYRDRNDNVTGNFQNGKLHGDVTVYNLILKEAKYDYYENGASQLTKKLTTEAKTIVDKQLSIEIASINKKVNEANTEINQLEEKLTKILSGETNFDEAIRPNEVKIGHQIWMNKNLDVDTFRNGDLVPRISDGDDLSLDNTPAVCDDEAEYKYGLRKHYNKITFSCKLYNWYAVTDKRGLCPTGWHVPSRDEWEQLLVSIYKTTPPYNDNTHLKYNDLVNEALGSPYVAIHLKDKSWPEDDYWRSGYGDNSSGFSAVPNRIISGNVIQSEFLPEARLWTSDQDEDIWDAVVFHLFDDSYFDDSSKRTGTAVRCVKNTTEAQTLAIKDEREKEEKRRKEEAIRKIRQDKSSKSLQFSTLKQEQEKIITLQKQGYDSRVNKKIQERHNERNNEARKRHDERVKRCQSQPNACGCKIFQSPCPPGNHCVCMM